MDIDIEMFVGMQKETGCMDSCGDCIAKEYCRKLIEPEEATEE